VKFALLTFSVLAGLYIAWVLVGLETRAEVKVAVRRFFWPLLAILIAVVAAAAMSFYGMTVQFL
jgi:hypothetical protein